MNQLGLGDHAALFYRTREEQLACSIPFITHGLSRNERCLYIADNNSVLLILDHLEAAGVDVDKALHSGALRVATKRDTYLRHSVFEPEQMVRDLCDETNFSLANGFAGFRATGETSWALDLPSAMKKLIEYETLVHDRMLSRFAGLCQYDETRFPERLIAEISSLHHVYIRNGILHRQHPLIAPALPPAVTHLSG